VRELVRPELSLGVGASSMGGGPSGSTSSSNTGGSSSNKVNGGGGPSRGKAMDEIHDYSEIYTPSGDENGLPLGLSQPPPPPMHR